MFVWCHYCHQRMCLWWKDSILPRQMSQKGDYSVKLSLKLMILGSSFVIKIHIMFNCLNYQISASKINIFSQVFLVKIIQSSIMLEIKLQNNFIALEAIRSKTSAFYITLLNSKHIFMKYNWFSYKVLEPDLFLRIIIVSLNQKIIILWMIL